MLNLLPRLNPQRRRNLCWLVALTLVSTSALAREPSDVVPRTSPQLELDLGGFSKPIIGLAFSNNGRYLAAEAGEAVRIWDLTTGELHATLRGYVDSNTSQGLTSSLVFSTDDRQLIVGAYDWTGKGAVRVYNMNDLSEIAAVVRGHNGPVDKIAMSRDGRFLATTGYHGVSGNREFFIWSWPEGKLVKHFQKRLSREVDERSEGAHGREEEFDDVLGYFGFVGQSDELLYVGQDVEICNARNWDFYTDIQQATPKMRSFCNKVYDEDWPVEPFADSTYFSYDVRFDLNRVAISGMSQPQRRNKYWCGIWSIDNPRVQTLYDKHRYHVETVVLSRDGRWAASGDTLGDVHVWDPRDGRQRYVFRGRAKAIYNVGFSADTTQLAFGTKPYGPDKWAANHYAALDRRFDLEQRVLRDGAPGDYQQPVAKFGNLTLRNYIENTGFINFKVMQNGRQLSFYPTESRIYSWTFLHGDATGLNTPVVFGDFEGGLAVLEGQPDERGQSAPRRIFQGFQSMVTAISESSDGRFLAAAGSDGMMRIYSLENLQPWGDLGFEGVSISDDYKVLEVRPVARSYGIRAGDQVLEIDGVEVGRFYRKMQQNVKLQGNYLAGQKVDLKLIRDGRTIIVPTRLRRASDFVEPLLNLFVADDNQWVMWTPRGYYDASPRGDQLIGWRVNRGFEVESAFYPASQFRKQLYRPDIIDEILKQGDVDRAIAAANAEKIRPPDKIDFREPEVFQRSEPPKVTIISPVDGAVVNEASVLVKVEARSQNSLDVTDVKIMVNGRPGRAKAIVREPAESREGVTTIVRTVALLPGRNVISALASNNTATSLPTSVTVTSNPEVAEAIRKPNLYMLAIGCAEYADEDFNLKYADDDAEAFAKIWKAQQGQFYDKVDTKLLTNKDATPNAIRDGMDWLVDSVTQHDLAIVFMSGHGVRDTRGTYYLATHELNPDRLRSTGIPYSDVQRLMEDLPCKVVMFVDTCHAGGITGRKALVDDPWRDLVSAEVGAILFASSHPREVSLENDEWQHGAFTRALIDAFGDKKCDFTGDGYVSVNELDLYLGEKVKELTGGKQHPVTEKPPTIRNFNLARVVAE